MKHSAEYNAFTRLVDQVLAVPHAVIKQRVEEHRKQADKNPKKRGPKRKVKPSSSGRASRAKG
jgi:hypothetical protein